jgi:hypothetical protein
MILQADLSNLTFTDGTLTGDQLITLAQQAIGASNQTEELALALEQSEEDTDIRDFYDIGLWGYCSGNKTGNGDFQVDFCSTPAAAFWFNPVEVWKLNLPGVQDVLPDGFQDVLDTYQRVSRWMFVAYALAFLFTIAELLIGLTAILSRLGSLATTIVSVVCYLLVFISVGYSYS